MTFRGTALWFLSPSISTWVPFVSGSILGQHVVLRAPLLRQPVMTARRSDLRSLRTWRGPYRKTYLLFETDTGTRLPWAFASASPWMMWRLSELGWPLDPEPVGWAWLRKTTLAPKQ